MSLEETKPNTPQKKTLEKLNISVLLADDDETVRGMTAKVLKHLGCTVEEVSNGIELVHRVATSESTKFGLIMTDNNMPGMDGIQAIENIRADVRLREIPIVLYSGLLDEDIEKRVNDLGGVSIEKPFRIENLREKIKEALTKPSNIKY